MTRLASSRGPSRSPASLLLSRADRFLGAGIVLHRLHSVNETWLHGRGRHLRLTGAMFTLAAFGLADLPPFGTFLGKGWITDSADSVAGGPWLPVLLSGVFCACTVLTAGAVLRFAGGVFYGLGDAPREDRAWRPRRTRRRGRPSPAGIAPR